MNVVYKVILWFKYQKNELWEFSYKTKNCLNVNVKKCHMKLSNANTPKTLVQHLLTFNGITLPTYSIYTYDIGIAGRQVDLYSLVLDNQFQTQPNSSGS